jgi:CheY-like chemotaxis protein
MADYLPTGAQELEGPELEIKSILLLDDDIDLADTLKRLLEARNFVVTAVKNGVEGLREVMALDFDVIICDLMMPAMPGDMFYLAVKKAKPHLAERFIFVTAYSDKPEVSKFLEETRGLVLMKPVSESDLIRTVSLVLKNTAASRP